MKFVLISRHTNGADAPEREREQNLKDMGRWMTVLKPEVAMPTRGGKSVTASKVVDYAGDLGGVIIFEAESLDKAIALTRQSPGLKYGFTHEVFPEVSLSQAAATNVKGS